MSYYATSDEILLKCLQTNDEKAFKEIYRRYWEKLYAYALKKLKSKENAEECVQNIFISLWEKRGTATSIEKLENYLVTALRYRIISHIEAALRSQTNLSHIKLPEADSSTEQALALHDLSNAISLALENLPEKTRKAFILSRFQKFSNKEIATEMDLSEKSVEYHITQSLKSIRLQLKDFMMLVIAFCFM